MAGIRAIKRDSHASAHSRLGGKSPALGILAGKTETHRHDGEFPGVVEFIAGDTKPVAQTVSRGIRERDARQMHFGSGRLAGNENAGAGRWPQHRPRFMRQRPANRMFDADPASADCRRQAFQINAQAAALGPAGDGLMPARHVGAFLRHLDACGFHEVDRDQAGYIGDRIGITRDELPVREFAIEQLQEFDGLRLVGLHPIRESAGSPTPSSPDGCDERPARHRSGD